MAFMISRETENVQSAHEVEAAFRALTTADKPYITANELFAVSVPIRLLAHGYCYVISMILHWSGKDKSHGILSVKCSFVAIPKIYLLGISA